MQDTTGRTRPSTRDDQRHVCAATRRQQQLSKSVCNPVTKTRQERERRGQFKARRQRGLTCALFQPRPQCSGLCFFLWSQHNAKGRLRFSIAILLQFVGERASSGFTHLFRLAAAVMPAKCAASTLRLSSPVSFLTSSSTFAIGADASNRASGVSAPLAAGNAGGAAAGSDSRFRFFELVSTLDCPQPANETRQRKI